MSNPFALLANLSVDATRIALEYREVPADQVMSGPARVGTAELGQLHGCSIGVWEMSPSVTTDVEVDEFFIVLSGKASVQFADGAHRWNCSPAPWAIWLPAPPPPGW
ncbi:cupin domain-containing protein [Aquitalea pelogenes]|uniref:cupin domain-containing protein n=1 Tax=Aquitalea pelogenes TaxID=1293573 RepID=UPI00195D8869|nr:cupin domain-containing protein [Aquitalea pelogenes]